MQVVFLRHAVNLSEKVVSVSVAHFVYPVPHLDSMHLRKSVSHLFDVAPVRVCCVAIVLLSRASIAARCARICSAIAESDSFEFDVVFDDKRALKLELLFVIVAQMAFCAKNIPQINTDKNFQFVLYAILLSSFFYKFNSLRASSIKSSNSFCISCSDRFFMCVHAVL